MPPKAPDTCIYLSPLAIGTGNIGEFILRNHSGTFVLETSPTVAELAAAQSWPVSTALKIALDDADMDGVWDEYVKGISDASGFGGAVDQIVASPSTAQGTPSGLVAADSDRKGFINSVMAWYENPEHFDATRAVGSYVIDGLTDIQEDYARYLADCRSEWTHCAWVQGTLTNYYGSTVACVAALASQGLVPRDEQGQPIPRADACNRFGRSFFGIVASAIIVKDFSSVPSGALEHVADFINIWEAGEPAYKVEDLADVLEDLLGIGIGGFDFTGIGHDDLDEADERRLFEIHQSLLSDFNATFNPDNRNVIVNADRAYATPRPQPTSWHSRTGVATANPPPTPADARSAAPCGKRVPDGAS